MDSSANRYKGWRYHLPKVTSSLTEKNLIDQSIHFVIKRYEKLRRLTTGQDEDYTTRSLLGYDYTKNHYRLIEVHLNREKKVSCRSESNSENIICWTISETRYQW